MTDAATNAISFEQVTQTLALAGVAPGTAILAVLVGVGALMMAWNGVLALTRQSVCACDGPKIRGRIAAASPLRAPTVASILAKAPTARGAATEELPHAA